MQNYSDRFKDALWFNTKEERKIHLIGVGGIGSNALYNLVKTIPATYYIQDIDTVERYNVNTQFFFPEDISKNKVIALKNRFSGITGDIRMITDKFLEGKACLPIIISAVDNMETRKNIFNSWKEKEDRKLLIDGRLRANLYEIYVVQPGMEERYEATLFEDADVDDGPCTFKQTTFFGMLIGARITQVLTNYFTNENTGEALCTIPFKINEFGDLFLFETEL